MNDIPYMIHCWHWSTGLILFGPAHCQEPCYQPKVTLNSIFNYCFLGDQIFTKLHSIYSFVFSALPTSLPWLRACLRIQEFCFSRCSPGYLLNLINLEEDILRNSHMFFGCNKFVFNPTLDSETSWRFVEHIEALVYMLDMLSMLLMYNYWQFYRKRFLSSVTVLL